jgi:hypothetical protein
LKMSFFHRERAWDSNWSFSDAFIDSAEHWVEKGSIMNGMTKSQKQLRIHENVYNFTFVTLVYFLEVCAVERYIWSEVLSQFFFVLARSISWPVWVFAEFLVPTLSEFDIFKRTIFVKQKFFELWENADGCRTWWKRPSPQSVLLDCLYFDDFALVLIIQAFVLNFILLFPELLLIAQNSGQFCFGLVGRRPCQPNLISSRSKPHISWFVGNINQWFLSSMNYWRSARSPVTDIWSLPAKSFHYTAWPVSKTIKKRISTSEISVNYPYHPCQHLYVILSWDQHWALNVHLSFADRTDFHYC